VNYLDVKKLILWRLVELDVAQHDDHVWRWLDYEACNANHLRDMIWIARLDAGANAWPAGTEQWRA
jgi:hypothetical protein